MLKSIFLKEWLKIRHYWFALLALNVLTGLYLIIEMRHQFRIEHSEMIWYWAFELRRILYTSIQYLPAATGALLAIAQFTPEMIAGRLRLSLHLPLRADVLVLSWVGFGALMGALLALLNVAALYISVRLWFPPEAVTSALLTALPWLLGGWVAYFSTALAMLEPVQIRRIVYLLLGCAFLALLYQERGYEEYNHSIITLMTLALLFLPAAILPAHRYRHRS